jgi:hypothetical protein
MTLEELENALPNGLHDAGVNRINVDYESTFDVEIWVGDMNDPLNRGHLQSSQALMAKSQEPVS